LFGSPPDFADFCAVRLVFAATVSNILLSLNPMRPLMKRVALYSNSPRSRSLILQSRTDQPEKNDQTPETDSTRPFFLSNLIQRRNRTFWVVVGGLVALCILWIVASMVPAPRPMTQKDIERAVVHTLETQTLPSPAAKAYEIVKQSVVRVRALDTDPEGDEIEKRIGTGVVIVDKGLILTNIHVVADSKMVKVVFADGLESEAEVVGLQPENDLAVLQAKTVPDDLAPAILGSAYDLAVGDYVVAVGFPFGIGPSVSAGVVSGLNREYRSPEGERLLTKLIQFDAAANVGNSGGPLVNANGEVVGIVTAILNPTAQRVFIGIGFAVTIESAATGIALPPF
jgi:S1-C subfamily serine protease